MQPQFNTLQAMLHCPYKAWLLSKEEISEEVDLLKGTPNPIAVSAWEISQATEPIKPGKNTKHAQKLLADTTILLSKETPPSFYKIPHCSECLFKNDCYKKLKDKDCISLLAGMTPKAIAKYHSKGIITITQLSHLFKPRRRRAPQPQSSYLWELKALAIREQKTFVIQPPVFNYRSAAIFLDFEGTSNENHIYLLGGLIIRDGKPDENFSFWSDHKEQEEAIFRKLFNLLHQYPDADIYHYGSYETKALRQAVKKWPKSLKQWPVIEKRMVNLLGYLRTHVYPPTYGNGLKELGAFLGFRWDEPSADGFLSMDWRRQWEDTGLNDWQERTNP